MSELLAMSTDEFENHISILRNKYKYIPIIFDGFGTHHLSGGNHLFFFDQFIPNLLK